MKLLAPILSILLLSVILTSCTRDTKYTVTALNDNSILVTKDKETMERMVDCAITRHCEGISVMKLLPSGKAFFVPTGTDVTMKTGLISLSDVRKIHILNGPHNGQDVWVYNRMLYQDKNSLPYQLAFASISQIAAK
jgi:hypothetical protein